MAELTYRAAIARGIAQEMRRDPTVVLIGEDIGAAGGVFKLTEGLFDEFGPVRVRDTPISEQAIVGAAMGAAMTGLRPIAELMFSDFFAVAWDIVANQIAKTRYMTDGQVSLPLVLRTANGAGLRFGAQHSQSVENWAMAIPGLKVVAPSTPADVVGLLAAAIRDPDPVVFCEHKALFAVKGEVPDGEVVDTLGTARIVRTGSDLTIVALAAMVPRAVEAADRLAADQGVEAEVVDLRSLVPRRGEPAALWLGRRDRLDRRRRRLLQPRCADRPDHDTTHPASVGCRARGSRRPDGGPHRRDDQATPRGRGVSDRPAPGLTAAVLGAGRMGSAMAERLASQGIPVVVYNRTPDRATALAARIGATVAATPAEAAERADVVISMVADDAAVQALYDGADGITEGIRAGAVAVDMSTVLPDTIRSVAPGVLARGAGILDAPVSGSVTSTLAGELTIMAGGAAADLERARPVLERLARRVFHLGGLGTGAAMKLAVNTVIFGLNGAIAEGLVLAERNGIERALAYDVLAASAVGAPFVSYKRAAFVEPDDTPVAFSLALAEKDLRLIRQLAAASATAMPQAGTNLETIRAAERSAGEDADFSMVASHLREEGRR